MTLTHPDTIPTTTPPSPGDLALTLTAIHAAATAGDLDGYTTGLQTLHGHTAACLRAIGAGFQCEACDTPIDLDQITVAVPAPATPRPLPAGKPTQAQLLRAAADLVETLSSRASVTVSQSGHNDDPHLAFAVNSADDDDPAAEDADLAELVELAHRLGPAKVCAHEMDEGQVHVSFDMTWQGVYTYAYTIIYTESVKAQASAWAAEWNKTRRS